MSLHLRGPLIFSKFAVYHRTNRPPPKEKRDAEPEPDSDHQYHPHFARHKRGHIHHRRQVMVTVTETAYVTETQTKSSSISSSTSSSTSSAPAPATTTVYPWTRDSYYNAATGQADNIVFMNHLGGQNGSGAWDSCFGNTLSYANSDGKTAAQSPQVLNQVTIPSNSEVILFTAQQCGDCGYVRPGTPAYRGFPTSGDTVFLMEFQMPHDGQSGFNGDMSAIWFLNAQIPRTLQYGNAACSCWTSGCGELDAFEILSSGSDFLISTYHSWQGKGNQYGGGGCSDYIQRPLSASIQAAIILNVGSSTFNIVTLPSNVDFAAGLTDAEVASWDAIKGSEVHIPA